MQSFRRSSSSRLEEETRTHAQFKKTESSLASVSTNQSLVSLKQHKASTILSYLGSRNPFPAQIASDDVVWLMDNVAFRGVRGEWEAEFVAAVFDQKASGAVVDIVGDIASKLGLSKGSQEEKTIEKRIAPFVMEILPGRQVKVDFKGTQLRLGPGGRNGISSDIKRIPDSPAGSVVESSADVPRGVEGLLEMKTVYAEPEGWAVLSGQ
jgi:RNase P/RNase MRP subunit p29